MFALKIFKNGERIFTITTRTGLVINEATLEIESDVSAYSGMDYVLFDIVGQKEIRKGVIDKNEPEEVPPGVNRY